MLLGGRIADFMGRKRMFVVGLLGFAAASALGGAATTFGALVVARACQGAFGALLAPAALSLLTVTFEGSADRGKAFGVFGAIAGAGGAVGLLLGGVLTEYLDWRWVMYVNVLIAVIAFTDGVSLLKNIPAPNRPPICQRHIMARLMRQGPAKRRDSAAFATLPAPAGATRPG